MLILSELHWLPVAQRIIYKVVCLLYRALNEASAPVSPEVLLCEPQNGQIVSSSTATTLVVYLVPTESYDEDRAFAFYAPRL